MHANEIADLSRVSPQRSILRSQYKKPKAASTLYISRSTAENVHGGQHHKIIGVHIVLAAGNANGLWDEFHIDRTAQRLDAKQQKKDDTKFLMSTRSLTICCDTLEVHGEFCLPEADLAVYARRLVWATEDAGINTSPLPWGVLKAPDAAGKTKGENGAHGRNAGSLKILVSTIESPDDTRPRLTAFGGRGQDPGNGLNGQPGKNMTGIPSTSFSLTDSLTKVKNTLKLKFSPPAVYIDARWYLGGSAVGVPLHSDPRGANSLPSSGTDAVAPGIPGNGGNGGNLIANSTAGLSTFSNDSGAAGITAKNCTGGAAGKPARSAAYTLYMYFWIWKSTNNPNHDLKPGKPHSTEKGKDINANQAPKGPGTKPDPVLIDCPNAWLHPLSLQTVLEFTRDLYLAGEHFAAQELFQGYAAGLELTPPLGANGWDDSPWSSVSFSQWTAAQTEVASMLQRLRGQLDYFGNPAGYAPFLSLQGSIKLYQEETKRALRTMLLVDWVSDETHKAEQAAALFNDLIDDLNQDTAMAVTEVTTAEKKIGQLTRELDTLQQNLTAKGVELAEKRTKLLGQAENNKQKQAIIKSSIKMAGAICQVIPVGQPVLGVVGTLAGVSADLIGSDPEGTPDTISRMGDVITKARAAANKSKDAGKKSVAEAKKGNNKDTEAAKESGSAMSQALDGVGPAINMASEAISALQVSEEEVAAELQRLEAACPELQTLLHAIHDLNETKTIVFGNLADSFHSLCSGYSRLSFNAGAIISMQQEKGEQLGRIDHEASLFVKQLGQRSRLVLLKYLYFMVKSYETTLLQTLDDVDWELSRVTAKINELLKEAKGFNGATLDEKAKTLEGLFQENINIVRQKLLADSAQLSERTMQRTLSLSQSQSPDDIAALNTSGSVVIDPFASGLVDPRTQLARLSAADLRSLEFDPEGPQLPENTQVIIDVIPSRTGTLRRDEALCVVYSESPVRWNWTCSHDGKIKKSTPSKGSEDLLDFILGEASENIRQKISRPPFWSNLTIRVRYLEALPNDKKPHITKLHFELSSDVVPAPDRQSVLMVHPTGPSAGGIINCMPKDLADREAGVGHFMRIYNKGTDIELSAPVAAVGTCFDHWQLIGTDLPEIYQSDTGKVKIVDDIVAQCRWVHAHEEAATFNITDSLSVEQLDELAGSCPDQDFFKSLRSQLNSSESEVFKATVSPDTGQAMRVEAHEGASIVGWVPAGAGVEVLQNGMDGWQEVNYRGVSGWIK